MRLNKITAIMSALLLNVTAAGNGFSDMIAHAAVTETISGDVNADGIVNKDDAMMLQQWLVRKNTALTNRENADINKDEKVNASDLTRLKRMLSAGGSLSDYRGLVINEVCTTNKKSLKDSNNNSPDWLELYNGSGKALDISGVGLSDGNKNRYKFTFPGGTVIESGGYVIVACDKEQLTAGIDFVAPFNLSASGETIYLTAPMLSDETSGADIDIVTVPALTTDVTYGRFTDGMESWEYLVPSPKDANAVKYADYVEAPSFSAEAGFYADAFELSLTAGNSDKIYYTLDGSDPTTSKTAQVYSDAIKIYDNTEEKNNLSARTDITYFNYAAPSAPVDKGIIVRAACKNDADNWSSIITKGYYIGKDESYSDIKVISLSTDSDNLFSKEDGIYVLGTAGEAYRNKVSSGNEGNTSNPTNYNNSGETWERPCNMQVYDEGRLVYTGDHGMRISGNWSRGFAQKSLRITARSKYGSSKIKYGFFDDLVDVNGNKIKEFDDIILHNGGSDAQGTHSRDELHHSFVEELDTLSVQATEPCIVFINGEYWGMYYIREKFNNDYVEEHYNIKNSTVIKDGNYDGSTKKYFEYRDLLSWGVVSDMSIEENYQRVSEAIDLDSLIDYMTVQSYINNKDWISKTQNYNWAIWAADEVDASNPYADGKWRFVLFDTDQGGSPWSQDDYQYNKLADLHRAIIWKNFAQLFYNLMGNADFRERFESRYTKIVDTYFNTAAVNSKINAFDSKLRAYIAESNERFHVYAGNYEVSLNNMKSFYNKRAPYAMNHMKYLLANYQDYIFIDDSNTVDDNLLQYKSGWLDADFTDANGEYEFISATEQKVDVQSLGAYNYSVQSIYTGFVFEKGKQYEVSFTASCESGEGQFAVTLGKQKEPWDRYLDKEVSVTTTPQKFTFTTDVMPATEDLGGIVFCYSYVINKYHVKDIIVREVKKDNMLRYKSTWRDVDLEKANGEYNFISATEQTADVQALGAYNYSVQCIYDGLFFEKGKQYQLSFTASCETGNGTFAVVLSKQAEPWDRYLDKEVSVTTTPKKFTFTTDVMPVTEDLGGLVFCYGYVLNKYHITDISLVEMS